MRRIVTSYPLFAGMAILSILNACATGQGHNPGSMHQHSSMPGEHYQLAAKAVEQKGQQGNFIFSLYSNTSPIPLNRIHSWTLKLTDPAGKPIEKAQVFVFGGMPMHRHDFPTLPTVTQYLGDGKYLIEGLKFNMIGHWQMRFNVKQQRTEDRAIFEIHL